MELQSVMLCEAVTIREGLLYILGGGVTSYSALEYPAPLGMSLAAVIELDYLDQGENHKFAMVLVDADACELGRLDGEFGLQQELDLDAVATLPVGIPLGALWLPDSGLYEIRLDIDDETASRLPLRAEHATQDR